MESVLHAVLFEQEKAGYIYIWVELRLSNTTHDLYEKTYCTVPSTINVFHFERNCRLQLQYVV